MKFHTVGNESGKIIVLIHGMLNPWQIWMDVANAFSEEYYVVIPELDAHTQEEPSHFISVEDEAAKIFQRSTWYLMAHRFFRCLK